MTARIGVPGRWHLTAVAALRPGPPCIDSPAWSSPVRRLRGVMARCRSTAPSRTGSPRRSPSTSTPVGRHRWVRPEGSPIRRSSPGATTRPTSWCASAIPRIRTWPPNRARVDIDLDLGNAVFADGGVWWINSRSGISFQDGTTALHEALAFYDFGGPVGRRAAVHHLRGEPRRQPHEHLHNPGGAARPRHRRRTRLGAPRLTEHSRSARQSSRWAVSGVKAGVHTDRYSAPSASGVL